VSRRRWTALAALLALAAALLVAACGDDDNESGGATSRDQPGKGKPAITLGTKDFPEEFILGELYKQALEAKGYRVTLKKNIGSTELIDKALTSKQIDAYPEYLGVTVATLARKDTPPKSAEETYDLAKDFYERRGQVLSRQTPFFDVDSLATRKSFAQENGLKTVADLKKLERVRIAAAAEFKNRFQGLKGLEQVYGLDNIRVVQVAQGVKYQALDGGDADASNVFSTDAQLASGKYSVLEDPEGIFGYQHVALVANRDAYEKLGGAEFFGVIDSLSKLLTNDAMVAMNKAVSIDKQPEADVARSFLRANKLV
jgi:osmoprotectant transport system substrate-binding protein